ncbi:MAG TPA: corrinoid protein-associated methyltransferase CpaM [bacterium]|nr:corrinoid protein-associated methyltransferase CpaM [bacterium]
MAGYIYMKILESQPGRYDRGISWLSLGQSGRAKRRIVDEHVRPGMSVLEIGAGTGTMALLAARKGARVLGFDVSNAMLKIARRKISDAKMDDRVELWEMGVSGMDKLPSASFDLVASTLVFSELSRDEQAYALREACRVLRPGGFLAIADEARPRTALKRLTHTALRLPLLLVTFALTQTSTKAVEGLEQAVAEAGFKIIRAERDSWDSFLTLAAKKEED